MMRTWITMMLAAVILPVSCMAETFVLNNGKKLEGKVLRKTQDGKVTLQTKKGILVYDVLEFSEDTRTEHFEEFETEVVKRRMAAAEAAREAAKTRPKAAQAPAKSTSRAKVAPGAKMDIPTSSMVIIGVGAVFCVIGGLWMIIAGFAVSPIWGIAFILSGSTAQLAFIFIHWEAAKRPFLTQVAGLALAIGGYCALQ